MQISLVGAGYWGSKLKAELETIPGVEDIEIIDIKDGKDLKDIKYDNVILATPAWDHYQQTVQLLQQGKNLYVEKPLALTTAECIDIKQNIKEQVLPRYPNHRYKTTPNVKKKRSNSFKPTAFALYLR